MIPAKHALAFALIATPLYAIGLMGATTPYEITSSHGVSMEPTISECSLHLVDTEADVQQGDIVVYYEKGDDEYVTHRAIRQAPYETGEAWVVKGDGNVAVDNTYATPANVYGTVEHSLALPDSACRGPLA